MRPLLRPGTHVLTRGDGRLQVGLDPQRALLLEDSAEVRALAAGLGSVVPAAGAGTVPDGLVDLLERHDLLVDGDRLRPLLRGGPGRASRYDAAAAAARLGDDAPGVLDGRARVRLDLRGFGHPAASSALDEVRDLLSRCGLPLAPRTAAATVPTSTSRATALGVLVGVGEPERDLLDPWTRSGTPYTLLRLTEGRAVLGPFVSPGSTACLRCIDAHHTDADPSWPLLVRQYATASARDRGDGAPEPVDPALASLAAAWTVRDVVTFAEGGRPTTWSTTLTTTSDLAALETRSWQRHPECSCTW